MREFVYLTFDVDELAAVALRRIKEALTRIGDGARLHVIDVEKSDQLHVVIGAGLTRAEAEQYLKDLEDDGE